MIGFAVSHQVEFSGLKGKVRFQFIMSLSIFVCTGVTFVCTGNNRLNSSPLLLCIGIEREALNPSCQLGHFRLAIEPGGV